MIYPIERINLSSFLDLYITTSNSLLIIYRLPYYTINLLSPPSSYHLPLASFLLSTLSYLPVLYYQPPLVMTRPRTTNPIYSEHGLLELAEALFDAFTFQTRCLSCSTDPDNKGFVRDFAGKRTAAGEYRRRWGCQRTSNKKERGPVLVAHWAVRMSSTV